jgi:hypothetical protein
MVSQEPSGDAELSQLREQIVETINSSSTNEEVVTAVSAYVDQLKTTAQTCGWGTVRPLFAEALEWLVTYREEIPVDVAYYDYDFEMGLYAIARLAVENGDEVLVARMLRDVGDPTDVFYEYSTFRRSLFKEEMEALIANAAKKVRA